MGYWSLSRQIHRWRQLRIDLCRQRLRGGECPGGERISGTLGTHCASILVLDLVGVVRKGKPSSSYLPFPYTSVGGILGV